MQSSRPWRIPAKEMSELTSNPQKMWQVAGGRCLTWRPCGGVRLHLYDALGPDIDSDGVVFIHDLFRSIRRCAQLDAGKREIFETAGP